MKVLTLGEGATTPPEELDLQPVLDGKTSVYGFPTDASGNYLCTLTYNETTRTVTLTPTGASFDVYLDGVVHTFTGAQSIVHGATQGGHFIYFDASGTLVTSQVPWDILTHAPVCYVFRDATFNLAIAWDERHHAGRDVYWHRNQHYNEGAKARPGFTLSGYVLNSSTSDASVTYAVSSGIVDDEDISVTTEAVADGGPYLIMTRNGASGDWVINRGSALPYMYATDILYNRWSGTSWVLTALGQNQYVNYYVLAATALPSTAVTPTNKNQIILIPGQAVHSSLANAQAEQISSLSWGEIPFQEVAAIYKVTFVRNTAYTTTGRCRIAAVAQLVGSYAQITASAAGDHGGLGGLLDDDHPQYPLITSGSGAPAVAPTRVGAIYVDTATPALYVGTGIDTSADWMKSGAATKTTVLDASGDFTLGATTQAVRAILVGAGGGGGSGGTADTGVACTGGAGGGGGAVLDLTFTRAEILAAYPTGVVPCVIGAAGLGGTSVNSATAAAGNNGGTGGDTTFGTLGTAYGGGGGGSGKGSGALSVGGSGASIREAGLVASTSATNGQGAGGNGAQSPNQGNPNTGVGGGGCAATGQANSCGYTSGGGAGGGAGAGVSAGNSAQNGAKGGGRPFEGGTSGANGGPGGASGIAGTVGSAPARGFPVGSGGGGGGAGSAGAGGTGGAGGIGSGGGGGGACRLNQNTGAGGNGGPGRIIIIEV